MKGRVKEERERGNRKGREEEGMRKKERERGRMKGREEGGRER